jgi:hypothetical protein
MNDHDSAQPPIDDRGIPWLTDPQRAFLAHLTVLTLLPQMQELKPDRGYTYERLFEALEDIDADGGITLRADNENVWVLISGESIVHAERDWLEYMTPRWAGAESN